MGPVDTGKWLTILGLGEDGPDGLSPASREALLEAEIVIGPPRHLALLGTISAKTCPWPVPFADGIPKLLSFRGRKTVVLVSGDPFWFGAGSVIARHVAPSEWRALPGASTFSLAAAELGWPLEDVLCRGLHAVPFARLRPDLAPGRRLVVTVRDGAAVAELAAFLTEAGFGDSHLHVLETLGGPRARARMTPANKYDLADVSHPVAVAIEVAGRGRALHKSSGQSDDTFHHDGQITKRPIRAMTLSALAPRPGELLWDIGAGSGSVALEWLLSDPSTKAIAIEARPDRAETIRRNAEGLGQDRLQVIEGTAPDALHDLPLPNAVFIGGGLNADLLSWLEVRLAPGTRIVVNAVTLETEALLIDAAARLGGSLLRLELSEAQPLGRFRGWKASYPLVQWSAVL
ncbi:MAG: precorrin-6y C5,15-methyltransferase (decarboxylating) subunit CbiE [Pseudomonadota bacterium]